MVVLRGGAVSYELGTPVVSQAFTVAMLGSIRNKSTFHHAVLHQSPVE